MDILPYLVRLGGVARTGQLRAAGYSRTDIARLAGAVSQPRRGVFVLPGCRPELLAAIRHNARASCASAAGHYGLWLRESPAQHHLACNHGHGSGFIRHRTVRFEGHETLPLAAVEDVVLHALGLVAVAGRFRVVTAPKDWPPAAPR